MDRFNPYSYEFHDDPFPVYRKLRDDAPCYHDDDLGFWALSRYDDVVRALHDPDTFCSRFGITLEAGNTLPMMLTTDPPEHTALRRLVSRAFTPRRVADLEPAIRALSTDYLERLRDSTRPDLIVEYAAPLPMDVISRLLGVPDGDQEMLRGWSDALLHREEGDMEVTPAGIDAAYQLYKYFSAFVADRRADTRADDLAAALVAAESEGEHLSDDQVVGFLFLLIIAGNETTTKLLGNCLLAMQRFPGERDKVVGDPGRIPDAIEEILRFEGSTQLMARTLTRAVEVHGREIPEGDKVLLLLGSANRDERVWDRPDIYDIDRAWPTHHLAFGHGIHVCLGAALARLEMRVSLEEFLGRHPDYEIDEDGLERVHSGNVRGYSRMPIRL
ncbi:MAG: cytochrome monooxygenase [Actinomycetia bacterium]|nr:cytochrome monooxygenase [Actinomycetes bacterium]